MIYAKDIMSEEVAVIYQDALIRQVAHLMLRDQVSGFPVVNKNVGVVGVITMTDLFALIGTAAKETTLEAFRRQILLAKDYRVEDVMSRTVISIKPETSIDEIIHLSLQHNIHFFPVMDQDGRMVGIVSRHDILNATFAYD